MVAIVTGNSLGLSLTSLASLGSQGGLGAASQGRNGEQVFVNAATGNLVIKDQDERLVGVGLSVNALRTYNSQGQLNDDNADNWAMGVYRQQMRVVGTLGAPDSQLVRIDQDGAQSIYNFDASLSAYFNINGAGAHDKITVTPTVFTWTDGDTGLRQTYDATGTGRLLSTTDTAGNSLSYAYDAAGQLSSIADASGETVFFDYSGTNLTQVRTAYGKGTAAATLTRVHYSYDALNRLSGVSVDLTPNDNDTTDGQAYRTAYTYDGDSTRVASIAQDDGTVLSFEYVLVGSDYRISAVRDAQGHATTYTYDTAARRTTVIDPMGQVTVFGYDAGGQLTRIETAAGATVFSYGEAGHVERIDHADGSFVTMVHDAQGNEIAQRDSAGNVIQRTYDARNQLLTETVYATAASSSTAAGHAMTSRHVYDAAGKNLLRFVVSAEGRVTEFRYDAKGNRTASLQYAGAEYPVGGLGATGVPTEAAMVAWASVQDGTQTVRTDMAYDYRGQLAKSTTYAATDPLGVGVVDGTQAVTQYVYDQSGQLLKTVSPSAGSTRFTYDGMGRVLTARDALNNLTVTQYDDAANRTTVTLANGLTTVSSFDNAGRLTSAAQASSTGTPLGTTQYFYDADNHLLMTQDPTGVRQWMLYDSVGRKVADIDAVGHLTEYRYNANGLLTLSISYANAVNLALLASGSTPLNPSLAAIRPAASDLDDKTWRAYDAADRLVKVVDASGAVTETQYDGASRVIAVVAYESRVDVNAFGDAVNPADVTPGRAKHNRITSNYYDNDGLLRTTVDGEGYLTEFRYDAAGRLVDQVRYASQDANVALVLTKPVADQATTVGAALDFTLDEDVFSDLAFGGPVTYTAALTGGAALPAWLSFDPATRHFFGTPGAADAGLLSVQVTATGAQGAQATTNFSVRTNTPPAAIPLANQGVVAGARFAFTTPEFSDADAGDSLDYAATLSDGSPLPAWLTFDRFLRTFTGTPPLNAGTIAIRVTGTDLSGAATSTTFNLVTNSLPVVVTPLSDQLVQAGASFSLAVPAASFADADSADILTFSASRADGSALPAWLHFDPATRQFSGTPSSADAGVVQVSVCAMDLAGAQVSTTFNLTVNAAPVAGAPIAAQTARPRTQFSFNLPAAAFTDTAGDWVSYAATLASGAPLPSWLSFEPTVGSFSGMPQYSDAGLLSIKVTATDRFGQAASTTFQLTVDTLPTTDIAGLSYGLKVGKAWNYTLPTSAFTDADLADSLSYTATLNTGAGLPSWLSFNPATRSFSGTPTAASTVTVRITATDPQGGSKYADITLRVVAATGNGVPYAADPVLGTAFAPPNTVFNYTVPSGAFVDVDGDSLTFTTSALPAWLHFNAATRSFSGTPLAADLGNDVVVTISAADPLGRIATTKLTISVGDHRPEVNLGIANQVATQGSPFNFSVPANAFVDSDAGTTFTYSAALVGGAALPAWLSFDPTTAKFSGTAGAADLGTLSVELKATDPQGLSITNVFALRVNASPTVPVLSAQKATVGQAWTFTSPTFPDADGDKRVYRPVGLPSWITFDPATRRFTGTPSNGDAGVTTITITSTDALGAAVTGSFTLTVNSVPMVVVPIANQSVPVGTAYAFQVPPVTFRDADMGSTITLSAKRSTGAALPTWLSFDPATGNFSGTPPSSAAGLLTITVTATDNFGAKVASTFTLSVERQPVVPTTMPNQTAVAGQVFSYAVPAFTELTGEPLRYRITSGSGEPLPSWLRFDAATRTLIGIPGDGDAGPLQLNVSAADPSGATSSRSFFVVVGTGAKSNVVLGADERTHTVYNARGQVVGVVDAENYLTESIYDADGNIAQTIRYANAVTADLDVAKHIGDLRPATSPKDQSTSYVHDLDGRVTQQTNAEGTVTTFVYDKVGNVTKTTTAVGTSDVRIFNVKYDQQGRVTARLSAEGGALLTGSLTTAQINTIWSQYGTSFTYDAAGRLTSETDPNGLKTLYFYDGDGRLTHTINAAGEVTARSYNTLGQLTAEIVAGQRLTAAQLAPLKGGVGDAAFRSMIDSVVNAGFNTTTSYEYNVLGQLSRKADDLGADWRYGYDAFGDLTDETRRITEVEPVGAPEEIVTHIYDRRGLERTTVHGADVFAVVRREFDAFGRLVSSDDANGNTSTQTYDRLGRVIATTDPLNATRVDTYDAFDRVLTHTDASGVTTSYSYDDAARSATMTTPEGVTVTTVRNREGQVHTVTDTRGNATTYTYDKNGQLTGTQSPLTSSSSIYDRAGRLMQTTDQNGNKVDYTYDAANRVLSRVVDSGTLALKTRYEYDAKGEQTAVIDANNVRTVFEFSHGGLVLSKTVDADVLKLRTSYEYDPHGNVLQVTSPGGTVTRYVYDGLGRRTEEHVDPDHLNLTRRYTYDGNGNVVTSTDENDQTTRYFYDADNRLIATLDPTNHVSGTIYDAEGRVRTSISLAAPQDLSGLPAQPTTEQVFASLQFDASHDLVELRRYDRDGRLHYTVNAGGDVTEVHYDANGNVSERIAYATKLSTVNLDDPTWEPAPVRDPAHDEVTRTFYDALNRAVYTVDGTGGLVQQKYDGEGNVVERIAYATRIDPNISLTQSALDAAAVGVAGNADNIDQRWTYDKAGRLSYSVDGANAVTHYEYDNNGNLARTTAYARTIAAGAAPASVVADPAHDRVTAMAYDTADRLVYSVDPRGALVKRTYDNNGNVVIQCAYDTTVPAGTPATLAALDGIAHVAADRTSRAVFDAANRQVFSIGPDGAVTEMRYDAHGSVTDTIAYSDRLSLDNATGVKQDDTALATLKAGADNGVNRHTRFAYDASGRLVFTVDAMGTVKGSEYDGVGRVTKSTVYGRGIDPAAATSAGDIAAAIVRSDDDAPDRSDSFEYDACGYLKKTTDALGGTESFEYDGVGNKTRYTNENGATWTYEFGANGKLAREISPQVDLYTLTTLGNGALTGGTVAHAAVVTAYTYDAFGNLKTRTEAQGRSEERTTTYFYDTRGHQVRVEYPKVGVYNAAADALATVGLAARTELRAEDVTLFTRTVYNVFREAVANLDVAGHWSYKAYDKAGQVRYDVDAAGYVTGYTRDTFGDVTQLDRYAGQTAMSVMGESAPDIAGVETALAGVNHADDRIVISHYDRLGRTVQVEEPQTYVYESVPGSQGHGLYSSKATRMSYNAFGELETQTELRSGTVAAGEWAGTTHYYDVLGREIATVDALGYLTTKGYDRAGNLTQTTEFADAISSWTNTAFDAGGDSSNNRTLKFGYDLLNRKVREYRENMSFGMAYGSGATVGYGTIETLYAYDAVGNLTRTTDANGGETHSYYDAMGRVTAVAAPQRTSLIDWSSFTPLTLFQRDAYGNVLVKVDTAYGAASVSDTEYTSAEPQLLDESGQPIDSLTGRFTFTAYDRDGHATQTTDANGHSRFASYDAEGRVAKQWQGVTVGGSVQTSFTVNRYDELGQLIDTIEPGTVGQPVVHHQQAYNAFGEVTSRSVNGVQQEYLRYDAAGNLWKTNEGDGVDRVMLYDQQGHMTAEIRSSTAGLIASQADALHADVLAGTRRVETRYDALGRAVERVEAERSVSGVSGLTEIAATNSVTGASVVASATLDVPAPDVNTGQPTGPSTWTTPNVVSFSWSSLAALGNGLVKVEFDYLTSTGSEPVYQITGLDQQPIVAGYKTVGGYARTREAVLASGDTGGTVSWDETAGTAIEGGISRITRVRVYKQDVLGGWHLMADNGATAPIGRHVLVGKPADLLPAISDNPFVQLPLQVEYRKPGEDWAPVLPYTVASLIDFGDTLYIDTSRLSGGTYEYRVLYQSGGDTEPVIKSQGTWVLSAPPLAVIGSTPAFASATSTLLRWADPGAGIEQVMHVRRPGDSSWWTESIVSTGAGTSGVDFSSYGAGDYEYELLYKVSGQTYAYAHATGNVHITASVAPVVVPPVGAMPAIPATLVSGPKDIDVVRDESGTILSKTTIQAIYWSGSAPAGTSISFTLFNGSGYAAYPRVQADVSGYDESGQPIVTGYFVDLSGVPEGNYSYRLVYQGASWPNQAQRTGVLTVYATVPGHYESREVPVTVPVTFTPADPSPYRRVDPYSGYETYTEPVVVGLLENGLWDFGVGYTGDLNGFTGGEATSDPIYINVRAITVTHYETHYETQSVWVPASGLSYSLSDNTPSYVPGYTIPGTPSHFTSTATTVAGALALSEGGSNDATLSIVSPRDDAERPTVEQTFDRWGNVLTVSDPRNQYWLTNYTYDYANRLIQQNKATPDGYHDWTPSAQMAYDRMGNLVMSVDARNNTSTRSFDADGNLVAEKQGWNMPSLSGYDAFGNKVVSIDALGNRTEMSYDAVGQLTQTRHIGNAYDASVQAQRYTVAGNNINLVAGWVAAETNTYDELGRKLTSTNGNGETTSYVYDLQGNVVSSTSLGVTTTATFDTQNRKVSEADANGNLQTWKYDYFGRYAAGAGSHVDIGGASYSYTYNGTGELLTQSNNRGQSIVNTYDGAGQLVQTSQSTRVTNFVASEGFFDEGITGFLRTTPAAGFKPVYQIFFGGDGGHFYTTNYSEYLSAPGAKEGVVGYVAETGDATHVALHRLRMGQGHVYLSSADEVKAAVSTGWVDEGVIGYIGTVDDDTTTAWYRMHYNGGAGDHYYTTNRTERNRLVGLQEIDQTAVTSYTYDLAGNKLSERMLQAGVAYEDNRMAYDAQGHLRLVTGLSGLRLDYDYDRNGNRIHTRSAYQQLSADGASMTSQVHDSWSAYDEQNRQVIADGVGTPYGGYGGGFTGEIVDGRYVEDANGQPYLVGISDTQGHELSYDADGNRVSDTSYGKVAQKHGGQEVVTGYTVWKGRNEDGSPAYILDSDGQPRVFTPDQVGYSFWWGDYVTLQGQEPLFVDGVQQQTATTPVTYSEGNDFHTEYYSYDNLNRLVKTERDEGSWSSGRTTIEAREYDGAGRAVHEGPGVNTLDRGYVLALDDVVNFRNRTNRYDEHGQLAGQHVQDSDGYVPYDVVYDLYDKAGNAMRYHVDSYNDGQTTQTRYAYLVDKLDGYKDGGTYVDATDLDPGHTSYAYDQNGRLTTLKDHTQSSNDRSFINDANGVVVQTVQDGKVLRNLVVNGEVIGQYGVAPDADKPHNDDGSPNFVNVNSVGDNFRAINSNFPSAGVGSYQVQGGDTLKSIATGAYGDASLWWKIAQSNGLAGDSDLRVGQMITIPAAADSGRNNAGTFRPFDASAMVGDTTPNLPTPNGPDCGGFGAVLMAIVVVVVTVAVTIATDGSATELTAETFSDVLSEAMANPVAVAAGATAGDFAGQVTANLLGMQHGIKWNEVALAGLGAYAGTEIFGGPAKGLLNIVVRAAETNALTQVIGVVTHLEKKFEWRKVAAAAFGAGVGEAVGSALTTTQGSSVFSEMVGANAGNLLRATLKGTAAGLATAVARGGRINAQRVAADAFGNALGEGLMDAAKPSAPQGISPEEQQSILGMFSDGPDAPTGGSGSLLVGSRYQLGDSGTNGRLGEQAGDPWPTTLARRPVSMLPMDYSLADAAGPNPLGGDYAIVKKGDYLEGITGGDKEMMGRYMAGMGLRNANGLPAGAQLVADWSISKEEALARANDFYAADGKRKADEEYRQARLDIRGESIRMANRAVADANTTPLWNMWDASAASRAQADRAASEYFAARYKDGPSMVASTRPAYEPTMSVGEMTVQNEYGHSQGASAAMGYNFVGYTVGAIAATPLEVGLDIRDENYGAAALKTGLFAATFMPGGAALRGLQGERAALVSELNTEMQLGLRSDLAMSTSLAPEVRLGNTNGGTFYNVASNGVRGEMPLTLEQRTQVQGYLSKFDMGGVTVRWVDDRNLNTAYGDMFGERILNIGSDVVPGNLGRGTLTANSRVSINGALAHELVGHMEAGMAGRTQDLLYLEEAQASIRAARFAPDLTSTERFTLLRDAVTRLQTAPGGPVRIGDVRDSLYIQHR